MAGKLKWLGKWLDAPSFVDQHQLPHGNRARLFQGPVSQETLIFYTSVLQSLNFGLIRFHHLFFHVN